MSIRRHFLQTGPAMLAAAGLAGADQGALPNDRMRIATIGFGGVGMGDTKYPLSVQGVELAVVSDIYDGRLTRAREVYGALAGSRRHVDYNQTKTRFGLESLLQMPIS